MSERKLQISKMKTWVNKNKKYLAFVHEHPEVVRAGVEWMTQQSAYDIKLMKDPDFIKEARKINEETDKKMEALKRKYIAKYIHEGRL